jgi:hypothetical protein
MTNPEDWTPEEDEDFSSTIEQQEDEMRQWYGR